jgi:hypothetical protein
MRRLLLGLPVLALLAGCGGLLFAQLEVPTVTVKLLDQAFPATPAGSDLVTEVQYDLGAQLPSITQPNVRYELKLTGLKLDLTSSSGLADFGGVQEIRIDAVPPAGSTLAPVELVSYQKPPPPAPQSPTSIEATGATSVDLAPYLQGGQLTLRVTAKGSLPTSPWNASVVGSFFLRLTLDYGDVVRP